jgi:hypothetical protein
MGDNKREAGNNVRAESVAEARQNKIVNRAQNLETSVKYNEDEL